MGKAMRKRMSDTAIEIAYLLQYKSAGTVEFILVRFSWTKNVRMADSVWIGHYK